MKIMCIKMDYITAYSIARTLVYTYPLHYLQTLMLTNRLLYNACKDVLNEVESKLPLPIEQFYDDYLLKSTLFVTYDPQPTYSILQQHYDLQNHIDKLLQIILDTYTKHKHPSWFVVFITQQILLSNIQLPQQLQLYDLVVPYTFPDDLYQLSLVYNPWDGEDYNAYNPFVVYKARHLFFTYK